MKSRKTIISSIFSFLFLLCFSFSTNAQTATTKEWHTAVEQSLQGKIKSWKMYRGDSLIRTKSFDNTGGLIEDSAIESYSFGNDSDRMPMRLKESLERRFSTGDQQSMHTNVSITFNDNGQIEEQKVKNEGKDPATGKSATIFESYLENTFDEDGRLLVTAYNQSELKTTGWNDDSQSDPFSFVEESKYVARFEYNDKGNLARFIYFDGDSYKNVVIMYNYDRKGKLIQRQRYDKQNIRAGYISEKANNKVLKSAQKKNFDLEKVIPEFWSSIPPAKQLFEYDKQGNKTKYTVVNGKGKTEFLAAWTYEDGKLMQETHYNPSQNDAVTAEITFDEQGNVIKETNYDLAKGLKYEYRYDIVYF